jgi:hypothetical protein
MSDPTDGEIIEKVLKEVSRRSLFGNVDVPVADGFVIKVEREWTDALEDVTDKIRLTLFHTGPQRGDARDVVVLSCDSMLEVMANTSKLIEDHKRLTWNETLYKWVF